METERVLVTQPAISTQTDLLSIPSSPNPPTITQPFQIEIAALGKESYSDSISVAALSSIAAYTSLYKHAELHSLSATIHPTNSAPSNPTAVALAWVPYNSAASPTQILSVYGGMMFCIGGSIQTLKPIEVLCDLSKVNPILKSNVTFSDTPKLLIQSVAPDPPSKLPTCSITIKGMIRLHSPLLQASA
ncbi:coat protein [Asclepias asymptomatic virus]|uniref:coat protein n=1 Tax=Asclepias asymptomatic virus TaxID=1027880 RepID=UPI00020B10FD|nr:coat protein [Asclepias asymptomatic virus]AEE02010.1 coat protein [Asclepias asymptomatic virus]